MSGFTTYELAHCTLNLNVLDQEAVLVLHLRWCGWRAGDATPSILDADQPGPGAGEDAASA